MSARNSQKSATSEVFPLRGASKGSWNKIFSTDFFFLLTLLLLRKSAKSRKKKPQPCNYRLISQSHGEASPKQEGKWFWDSVHSFFWAQGSVWWKCNKMLFSHMRCKPMESSNISKKKKKKEKSHRCWFLPSGGAVSSVLGELYFSGFGSLLSFHACFCSCVLQLVGNSTGGKHAGDSRQAKVAFFSDKPTCNKGIGVCFSDVVAACMDAKRNSHPPDPGWREWRRKRDRKIIFWQTSSSL